MTLTDELDHLRDGRAVVDRSDRGFVVVSGPDALSFLQVLVSADLDAVAAGEGTPCLLLTPQGKLDVAFRLLRVGDDAWLDCDPGFGGQLAASLLRFRIRVDADVADRTGEFGMRSSYGDAPVSVAPALHAHRAVGDARVVRTPWGFDLLGPLAAVADAARDLEDDRVEVSAAAYDAWRIAHGVPVQPFDVDEHTIPQEASLELDAVSFTKGCFLGQELVCRIDSRGHVNRFLRRLVDITGDRPARGAEIVADGKAVGAVTSVVPAGAPAGALGYVRREVEPGSVVELRGRGTPARAVVAELDD